MMKIDRCFLSLVLTIFTSMQLSLLSLLGLRSCDDDDDRRDESEFRSHCVAEATEECGGDDLNRRRPNSKPV